MLSLANKLSRKTLNKTNIRRLAETVGVYIFWDKKRQPVYIGKANNLKRRVESYLIANLSTKTATMVSVTQSFSTILVESELEALLLEALLVRKNQPKYNSQLRDDKHPLYIKITKEKYPRILTARKIKQNRATGEKNIAFYGPFPSAGNVRDVLKMLRRIFPYSTHKIEKRGCLYSQIGLCYPCPSKIEKLKQTKMKKKLKKEYLNNIRMLRGVLSGRIKFVRNQLETKMKKLAKIEKFEEAAMIRKQIEKLDYITQPVTPINRFLKSPNLLEDIRQKELKQLSNLLKNDIELSGPFIRLECFDVAHLAGVNPTASMVTFIKGEADKSFYRHFKIRQEKGRDDVASLKEVAKRRIKHLTTWGVPDLIIVDGGKAQVSVFFDELEAFKIPVVGLAKRHETLIIPQIVGGGKSYVRKKVPQGPALNLLQRIRDEAHRFARRYHHKLLQKDLIPNNK